MREESGAVEVVSHEEEERDDVGSGGVWPPAHQRPALFGTVTLLVGVLGILAAVLVPLAPVITEDNTVTWPKAGEAPESTTAFFAPFAPASVHLRVPELAVRAGLERGKRTTVVGSTLPGNNSRGFEVATEGGRLHVLIGGHEVYRSLIQPGDASVDVKSGSEGSRVCVGEDCRDLPQNRVREVFAFSTDLEPGQARGMRVEAHTSNWFENFPSTSKIVLIAAQGVLALLSLGLLVQGDRRRRARAATLSGGHLRRGGWIRGCIDVGVLGILGSWTVLGPRTPDDSFTEGIVRNALHTGALTNYYRWGNAGEAPFTLALHSLEPLVALGANPLVLRIPSMLLALLSWLLLSRGVLPVVLPNHARRLWVRGLAATSLLLWWLPFDLGVRPEPFVAFGATAVLTCVLRAIDRCDGAGLTLLGVGGLALGLSVAVNPVGIVAAAPVVLLAPRIWQTLRRSGPDLMLPGRAVIGWLGAVGCLAAVGVVAMFADQSWYGVSRATELHRFYGPSLAWFREISRYEYLLGFDGQSGMGRRLPVLITFALLVCAVLALARGASALPGLRSSQVPVAVFVVALGLLSLTPSKWTHYFGALAGLGGAALTTAIVVLGVAAREWARQRATMVIGVFGTVLTVLAISLAFSGENTWFLYSHFGVPNDDGPFRPFDNPLFWLALVGLLLVLAMLPTWRDRLSARGMFARMPAVLGAVAAVSGVVVLLVSFAVAPARQAGSYSVGDQNLRHLSGGSCGVADRVVTTRDVEDGVLKEIDGTEDLDGFLALGGYPDKSAPGSEPGTGRTEYLWGSHRDGDSSTGRMTSRWFELPELGEHQELAVDVAGRTGDGNRLVVEFGRSDRDAVRPTSTRALDDAYKDSDERPKYPTNRVVEDMPQNNPSWRTLHIDSSAVDDAADRVRIHAVDATVDSGGWIATTGPRIRNVAPLRPTLRSLDSVYVDWSMVWNVPCVKNSPVVANGIAEAPKALVIPPSSLGFDGRVAFVREAGGSFAGVDELGQRATVPTRLVGTEDKPEYEDWGQLVTVSYPMRRDAYDQHTVNVRRWGWMGDRPPLGYPSR